MCFFSLFVVFGLDLVVVVVFFLFILLFFVCVFKGQEPHQERC